MKNLNNEIKKESFNLGEKSFNDYIEEIEKSGEIIEDKKIQNNIKEKFHKNNEKEFEEDEEENSLKFEVFKKKYQNL